MVDGWNQLALPMPEPPNETVDVRSRWVQGRLVVEFGPLSARASEVYEITEQLIPFVLRKKERKLPMMEGMPGGIWAQWNPGVKSP